MRLAVAAKTHRRLPDILDEIKHPGALLLAQSVAEQTPKQANVFAQGPIFVESFRIVSRIHGFSD